MMTDSSGSRENVSDDNSELLVKLGVHCLVKMYLMRI